IRPSAELWLSGGQRFFSNSQSPLALLRSKRMLDEEFPQHPAGLALTGCAPNDPFRQGLAAWPGMASTLNGIENHVGILSAVRISETADARRDSSVDRVSFTLAS